jgi:hypothetical protein
MMYGYFDESERTQEGVFVVAGCLFARERALRFKSRWDSTWKAHNGCHMADFVARQGAYKGISDEGHAKLVKRSVQLLTLHVEQAVVITCDTKEVGPLVEPLDGFRSPYGMCSTFAAMMLAHFWRERSSKHPSRIEYILEAGHKDYRETDRFLQAIADDPFARRDFLYHSHSFVEKRESTLLQAPDFFSWEWNRFVIRTVLKRHTAQRKPMRKSLASLLDGLEPGGKFEYRHLSTERLAQHKDILRHLLGDLRHIPKA